MVQAAMGASTCLTKRLTCISVAGERQAPLMGNMGTPSAKSAIMYLCTCRTWEETEAPFLLGTKRPPFVDRQPSISCHQWEL